MFSTWSGPNAGDITYSGGVFHIVMNSDKAVTANFTQITYTLTAGNDDHGTVTLSPSGGVYAAGTTVTLTPNPSSGYSFSTWSGPNAGDITYSGGVFRIVMNSDKAVTANFTQITYTLTAGNDGHGTVTLSPSGGVYAAGTTVMLTPNPGPGYAFSSWTGANAADVVNTGGVYTIVMNGNKAVIANFTQITYTLTAGNDGHGTVTLSPSGGVYAAGATVTLTPNPASGYTFSHWTGANASDVVNNGGVFTLFMNSNKAVTANFIQITYALTAGNDGHGTVTLNPAGGIYPIGTTVTLTPSPSSGYTFTSWSGADSAFVINTNGVYTIVMNANKTVQANFSQIQYLLTMAVSPEGCGTTTPAVGVHHFAANSVIPIIAVPAAGYRFVNWSRAAAQADSASTTVTLDGNRTVTAYFEEIEEVVSVPCIPTGPSFAFRGQLLTFSVDSAASNLGHEIEYEFDWGDANFSEWGTCTDQQTGNITKITSPNGQSGLPGWGRLMDYQSGDLTDITLQVTGGYFKDTAGLGAEPKAGTDAHKFFNGIVSCLGTISYENAPDSPLIISLRGLDKNKKYHLVFFSNIGAGGWDHASSVSLFGAAGFANESSNGTDEAGQPLFSGANDASTRLPADNTNTGYIARFTNLLSGEDGEVELRIDFAGKPGQEYKGKAASALMLQELDAGSSDTLMTAYNDFAWGDGKRSHIYKASAIYSDGIIVRARARCRTHPEIVSNWSDGHTVVVKGITLAVSADPAGGGQVNQSPQQTDYDFGSQLTLSAVAGTNYQFRSWNGDEKDTTSVKSITLFADTSMVAHFILTTDVAHAGDPELMSFHLQQNYPNPFNPETCISYQIPEPATVVLRVFNTLGQEIATLVNGTQNTGNYQIRWDARDYAGRKVTSGVYLCRLEVVSSERRYIKDMKMLLLQ